MLVESIQAAQHSDEVAHGLLVRAVPFTGYGDPITTMALGDAGLNLWTPGIIGVSFPEK